MVARSRHSGVLTFLFTDIVRSTERWERDPAQMDRALAAHDDAVRRAIAAHDGTVFATAGDGFGAVFTDPDAAVRAAAAVHESAGMPIRIGIHTGTAFERDGDYFGPAVNRAARITAAGHEGQILLSAPSAALLDASHELTALGEHRLDGIDTPLPLWQVGRERFGPLRAAASARGNLVARDDAFVGRTDDLAAVDAHLRGRALVTLVGPGGVGKTRLATEVAVRAAARFTGGSWFVDLSHVRSDDAVVGPVADVLGIRPGPGPPLDDRIVQHLARSPALLVVDNCEHVVDEVAALITHVLRSAPQVRVLATSRVPLRIAGEQVYVLGSLDTSGPEAEAVTLLFERAREAGWTGRRSGADAATAAHICRRLDGLPLAIELAAARCRSLGLAGVEQRLEDRFQLLVGGRRSDDERHRTIAAALDWSYDLLGPVEQHVFDRLGVFAGPFGPEDAVAVAAGEAADGRSARDPTAIVEAVSALVEASMCHVESDGAGPMYRYLESTREYALEHLRSAGRLHQLQTRHADRLGAFARDAARRIVGPSESTVAREIAGRSVDLRAALTWAFEAGLDDVVDGIALLAATLLWRGEREPLRWFADHVDDREQRPRVLALAATHHFLTRGDLVAARRLAERSVALEPDAAGGAATNLGWIDLFEGDAESGLGWHERDAASSAALGADSDEVARWVLGTWNWAVALHIVGRDAKGPAREVLERAATVRWPTGLALGYYAEGVALEYDDPPSSLEAFDVALRLCREVDNRFAEGLVRRDRLGVQRTLLTRSEMATELVALLRLLQQAEDSIDVPNTLTRAVECLVEADRPRAVAQIVGWLDGRTNRVVSAAAEYRALVDTVQASLGADWQTLIRTGRRATLDEIIDLACTELSTVDR